VGLPAGRRLHSDGIHGSSASVVDIFVESAHMDEVVQALSKLTIEVAVQVTGEFDIVTLVTADDIEGVQDVLRTRS